MSIRTLLALAFVAGACSAGGSADGSANGSAGSPAASLAPAHATAMRDSVRGFLDAYAADVSAPPVGKNAREAVAPFFAPEIVMSGDLAPDEPMLVQTVDSLVPPDEKVTVPD
jgi:hypothetical protein